MVHDGLTWVYELLNSAGEKRQLDQDEVDERREKQLIHSLNRGEVNDHEEM